MIVEKYRKQLSKAVPYIKNLGIRLFKESDYLAEYSNNTDWNILVMCDPRDPHLFLSFKYKPKDKQFQLSLLADALYNQFNVSHPTLTTYLIWRVG